MLIFIYGCKGSDPDQLTEPWALKHSVRTTTLEAVEITSTTAIIKGMATSDGVVKIIGQGFCVRGDLDSVKNKWVSEGDVNWFPADTCYPSGIFTTKLLGLKANSVYSFEAHAHTVFTGWVGKTISFTTLP